MNDIKIAGVHLFKTECRLQFSRYFTRPGMKEHGMIIPSVFRLRAERKTGTTMSQINECISETMDLTGYAVRLIRRQLFIKECNVDTQTSF